MEASQIVDEITPDDLRAERFDDVPEGAAALISDQYRGAALRIVVQRNDFLIPNLIDMLRVHKTIEISPSYQRRQRWDRKRKSRLIESFLVNIPVPPVFLYETEYARYEVMDGQQRMTTLLEYFENQFALTGLEILTHLNNHRFHQLPSAIRAGIERRYLSAIILLKESTPSTEAATFLRQRVFERLNTGGIRLNAQEVRNALHAGPFNNMLLELSRSPRFAEMWDIPLREAEEAARPSRRLANNSLFRRMGDVELVLRVFALLEPENIGTGMKSTLDTAMSRLSSASLQELASLMLQYTEALGLAYDIRGVDAFRLSPGRTRQRGRPSASLYDALMVALIRMLGQSERIRAAGPQIKIAIDAELNEPKFKALVVGRANTRAATIERATYVETIISRVINNS